MFFTLLAWRKKIYHENSWGVLQKRLQNFDEVQLYKDLLLNQSTELTSSSEILN